MLYEFYSVRQRSVQDLNRTTNVRNRLEEFCENDIHFHKFSEENRKSFPRVYVKTLGKEQL